MVDTIQVKQAYDLTTKEGFTAACTEWAHNPRSSAGHYDLNIANAIYCPGCGARRRAVLKVLWYYQDTLENGREGASSPTLARMTCVECHLEGIGHLYSGPDGVGLFSAWPVAGGVSTPRTPPQRRARSTRPGGPNVPALVAPL